MNNAQYLVELDRAAYEYAPNLSEHTHECEYSAINVAVLERSSFKAGVDWRHKRTDPEKEKMKELLNRLHNWLQSNFPTSDEDIYNIAMDASKLLNQLNQQS